MMRVEYQTSFHLRSIKSRKVLLLSVEWRRSMWSWNRFKSSSSRSLAGKSLWQMRESWFLHFKVSCFRAARCALSLNPRHRGSCVGEWGKSHFHLIKTSSCHSAFICCRFQHTQQLSQLNYVLIDAVYVTRKQFVCDDMIVWKRLFGFGIQLTFTASTIERVDDGNFLLAKSY